MVALASLVLVVGSSAAFADIETGTIKLIQDKVNYSYGNGGEFWAKEFTSDAATSHIELPDLIDDTTATNGEVGANFQTFCVEYSEHFNPGTTYAWNLWDRAVAGGSGTDDPWGRAAYGLVQTGGDGDAICPETAWLYTKFWSGTLTGISTTSSFDVGTFNGAGTDGSLSSWDYVYSQGSGRVATAGDVQKAIWFLEDEMSWSQLSLTAKGLVWAAHEAWLNGDIVGIGDVGVLNLTLGDGLKQDQLVMTDGTFVFEVPLPPAAPLGLVLMAGLGLYSRMRRRRRLED
jgi:hypothetical protein